MELGEARMKLDRIDKGMLELFEHRMAIVEQIAQHKEANNLPVRDKAREQEIIASVAEQLGGELAPYGAQFMAGIIEISCDYQTKRRAHMGKSR